MTASYVINKLRHMSQTDTGIGIAYFYCSYRLQQKQEPVDLLTSLLKQLLQLLPSLPRTIREFYMLHQKTQSPPSLDSVSRALELIVSEYSRVFIVIDALDEFQYDCEGLEVLLPELFNMQDRTATNLFFTSRPYSAIEKALEGRGTLLKVPAFVDPVLLYLDKRILGFPSFIRNNSDLQKEIRTTIMKTASGMQVFQISSTCIITNKVRFLLARMQLDSLIGLESSEAINTALKSLPITLDEAYFQIMKKINRPPLVSCQLAKGVLSWIMIARRSLTMLELQNALAVKIGDTELDEKNILETDEIVSVCRGLVTVDEESNIVQFVHPTVSEFLQRNREEFFPGAEAGIALVCITYLSFDIFESGFCHSDEESENRLRSSSLYDYAARNWGHHSRKAPSVQASTLRFLKNESKVSACSQAMMISTKNFRTGYSQKAPTQITGLHLAVWFGLSEILTILMKGRNYSDSCDSNGRTPISYAAENGYLAVIRSWLTRDDVFLNSKDKNDRTSISYAAENGHLAVVESLLDGNGVLINSRDGSGRTPISYAAGNGYLFIVDLLLKRDSIMIDLKDKDGRTPLSWAAKMGHQDVVELLLHNGVIDVNPELKQFTRAPSSLDGENGHDPIIKRLIAQGNLKVDTKNKNGQISLSLAKMDNHDAILDKLTTGDNESSVYERSDVVSIFSDNDFVCSSQSSTGEVPSSAISEVSNLLLHHSELKSLFDVVITRIEPEKFERNFRRFLQRYGRNLREQALDKLDFQAARFIRVSARPIAAEIKKSFFKENETLNLDKLGPENQANAVRLSQWLKSIDNEKSHNEGKKIESTPDDLSDSDKSNQSDFCDNDSLQKLDGMKKILTSGKAFNVLCETFQQWLTSSEEQERGLGDQTNTARDFFDSHKQVVIELADEKQLQPKTTMYRRSACNHYHPFQIISSKRSIEYRGSLFQEI